MGKVRWDMNGLQFLVTLVMGVKKTPVLLVKVIRKAHSNVARVTIRAR